MDHSYRNPQAGNQNGGGGGGGRGRMGRGRPAPAPKFFQHPEIEPLPLNANAETKIYCFIDDLFFLAKIQEVSRKLNIKVEFVKTGEELFEKMGVVNGEGNGATKPSLIIFDLNNANAKPLTTIPKLKKTLKKETTIIGFLSHLQAELKSKAQEAGCDMVLPRSAFSSNLPQLLRRHAAEDIADEIDEVGPIQ
jgi:CheY-like chemotaxis protein